jgi:hypothetical protein
MSEKESTIPAYDKILRMTSKEKREKKNNKKKMMMIFLDFG